MHVSMDKESKFRYLVNLSGIRPELYWLTNLIFDVGVYIIFGLAYFIVIMAYFGVYISDYFGFPFIFIAFAFQLVLLIYLISTVMKTSN